MFLKDKQLIEYRDKLDRISAPHQCILQRSGIFEITLLSEGDADKIYRNIKSQDYIQDVRKIETSKYDFGHFNFNNGRAEPKKYYSVRGILKEIPEKEIEYKGHKIVANREGNSLRVRDYKVYDPEGNYLDIVKNIEEAKKLINDKISAQVDEALIEGYPDREKWISVIRSYGKNYNFDKYTDEQIFRIAYRLMYEQPKSKKEIEKPVVKHNPKCPECGHELNDAGECPLCDLGDESVLDEDIEKHDTLNPKLWNEDKTLKSEVKEKIDEIVKNFTDQLTEDEIKFKLLDVKLVGSNCSYNYTKDSDLDIHVVFDLSIYDDAEKEQMAATLYDYARSIWNKNHDVKFYDIPVEIYVETEDGIKEAFDKRHYKVRAQGDTLIDEISGEAIGWIDEEGKVHYYEETGLKESRNNNKLHSNGIYSVMNDAWIKEPVAEDIPEVDKEAFEKELRIWEDKYFDIKENPSADLIKKFMDDIYDLRVKSIANEGEYSLGNLVFKECRARGYLDDLRTLKTKLEDKELSL